MKIFQYLFYIPKHFYSFARKVYRNLRKDSKLWALFSMFIESNITILVFCSANQFLVNGYFSTFNKMNFIACISTLFLTLFYSVAFYPLIYNMQKKSAETLLCHSKNGFKSYFMESFCYLLRCFVRGSIQGIGILSYQNQLIALIVSDVFFLLMVILFKDEFIHKSVTFF